jgi:hypothetical protein
MEQEDARSLVVETALRAKEEKLRLARERKAREEEERQARRRREQAEVAAEEERRRQALLARERALREEERRANAKEQREYQERLEAAMDERVKERERREEQAAQSVAALPSWFSFSALLLGLRRKDVPPGALSPHASTSPSTPPQRPSITNTNATISFLPSVNTTQTRQQRPTTVGSSSSSTFSVDAKRSGSPSRALRILSTTTSSSFSPQGQTVRRPLEPGRKAQENSILLATQLRRQCRWEGWLATSADVTASPMRGGLASQEANREHLAAQCRLRAEEATAAAKYAAVAMTATAG